VRASAGEIWNEILRVLAKRLISLLEIGFLLAAFGVGMSLFASLWWFADLWAHFTVQYAVILGIALLWFGFRKKRKWFLLVLPFALIPFWKVASLCWVPPSEPTAASEGETIRLLVFNVLSSNSRYTEVQDYLEKSDADVVGLLEVSPDWVKAMAPLHDIFPHRYELPRTDNFGIAVYSRIPIETVELLTFEPAAIPTLDIRFDSFRVLLTHPIPPLGRVASRQRDALLMAVASSVAESGLPTLIAGDFNQTPWSPRFQKVKRTGGLRDSSQGRWINNTWQIYPTFMGGLAIDHVLHTPDIKVLERKVGGDLGSDHRPVVVDFQLPSLSKVR